MFHFREQCLQCRPGAGTPGFHRARPYLQDGRDLLQGQIRQIDEEDGLPLILGESFDGVTEGDLQINLIEGFLGAQQALGDVGGVECRRFIATEPGAEMVVPGIDHQAVQPRRQGGVPAELREMTAGPEKRVLDDVVRLVIGTGVPAGDTPETETVSADDFRERGVITVDVGVDEMGVIGVVV